MFNVVSALVKGVYIAIKRMFIDIEGIEFTLQLFSSTSHAGLKKKCLSLIADFLSYDNDISGPEEMLMTEQDRIIEAGKKATKHISLKEGEMEEKNQEQSKDTQLPSKNKKESGSGVDQKTDNKKYKDATKKALYEADFLGISNRVLNAWPENLEEMDTQERRDFLYILKLVVLYAKVNKKELNNEGLLVRYG